MLFAISLIIITIFLIFVMGGVFICFIGLYRKMLEIGNKIEEVLGKIDGGVETGIKETKAISQEIVKTSQDVREIKSDFSEVLRRTKNIIGDIGFVINLFKGGTKSIIAYSQALAIGVITTVKAYKNRHLK